jgi:hypothetical protein
MLLFRLIVYNRPQPCLVIRRLLASVRYTADVSQLVGICRSLWTESCRATVFSPCDTPVRRIFDNDVAIIWTVKISLKLMRCSLAKVDMV